MEMITEEVFRTIRKIIRHSELYSHQFRRHSSLTRTQFLMLHEISRQPHTSIGEMAEIASLSQATATTALDGLEKMGLAERYRSGSDKRKVYVRLTESGISELKSAPAPIYSHFIERLESLKPHECSAVLSALQLVEEMMETPDAQHKDSNIIELEKKR